MAKKYIVKNCPCYELGNCNNEHIGDKYCQDCTECTIKQVVVLVEAENKVHRKIQRPIPTLNGKILQTLQVEEVE